MDRDHFDSYAFREKCDMLEFPGDQMDSLTKYHVYRLEQPEFQGCQQSMTRFQSSEGGSGDGTPVRFHPQLRNPHIDPHNLGPVKLEHPLDPVGTGFGPVKREHQHYDQHQQSFHEYVRSSQNAFSDLNPCQQQQLPKAVPQQGSHQVHQQFQQQNLITGSTTGPVYELGMCAQRLSQYMSLQKNRPNNNSIDFWNVFVDEFFAPNAKKRWCLSSYQNSGEECGAFNQDLWNCELCNCKPGRGFETTFEALPRLLKMKYDSGTVEELLSIDMPRRYCKKSGHIILEYAKATQESVFKQLRIARDGQLRIVFSPDLKICLWEFCARSHEVLIPRRSVMPEVSKLETTARNYQSCALSACYNESVQDLELRCDMFVESACQLQKALEVPSLLTKIGYMQNFGRCLQLSDTFCRMKGLIDYSRKTGKGPIESYNSIKLGLGNSAQKQDVQQQNIGQSMNSEMMASANAVDEFLDKILKNSPLENQMMSNPSTSSAKFVDEFLHKLLKDCPLENQMMKNPSSSSKNRFRASRRTLPSGAGCAKTRQPASSQLKQAEGSESEIQNGKIKKEAEC